MTSDRLDRAGALEREGRIEEARILAEELVRDDPRDTESRCLLSRLAIRRRDFDSAACLARRTLALAPAHALAQYLLSVGTSEQGDVAGATAAWQRTTHLASPGSEPARQASELAQVFAWLVPADLPTPRIRVAPADRPKRWFFVWRELGELLHHFHAAAIGEADVLSLDRGLAGHRARALAVSGALDLLVRCEAARPDIVVAMPGLNPYLNPNAAAFSRLRDVGIPTVLMLPDLRKGIWQRLATAAAPHFDLVVSLDGCALNSLPALAMPADRYMQGWSPVHPPTDIVPFARRSATVNMVGSLWGDRRRAADALAAAGIDVLTRERLATQASPITDAIGARRAIPTDAYADSLRRSQIAVNFSLCQTGEGHQLKGRVFEAAAAGTLLLESANDVTPQFFEPSREYIPFADLDDLQAKVAYFLANPNEAEAIAGRARARLIAAYGATRFWKEVAARAARSSKGPDPVRKV